MSPDLLLVFVILACRMKFLGRRWKRATRVGTPVIAGSLNAHPGGCFSL